MQPVLHYFEGLGVQRAEGNLLERGRPASSALLFTSKSVFQIGRHERHVFPKMYDAVVSRVIEKSQLLCPLLCPQRE